MKSWILSIEYNIIFKEQNIDFGLFFWMKLRRIVIFSFFSVLTLVGFFLSMFAIKRPEKARKIEASINRLGQIRFPPRSGDQLYKFTWKIFILLEIVTMLFIWAFVIFDSKKDGSLRSVSFFIEFFKGVGIQNETLSRLLSIPLMLVMMALALLGPIVIPITLLRLTNWVINKVLKSISRNPLAALGIIISIPGVIEALIQLIKLVNNLI